MNFSYTRKTGSRTTLFVLLLVAAVSGGAIVAVYAIDNVGSASDVVSLFDMTSLRNVAKDSIGISEESVDNSNQIVADVSEPVDGATPASSTKETISALDGGATYPVVSAAELHGVSDQTSLNRYVFPGETLGLSDAIITALGQAAGSSAGAAQTAGGSGGGASSIVYDDAFLESNPLLRVKIGGLYFLDEKGGALAQLRADKQPEIISVTIRNFQNSDLPYVVIIQTTDGNGYTVQISAKSGVIGRGSVAEVRMPWPGLYGGTFDMKVMVWNSLEQPLPLGEAATREVRVN